MLENEKQAEFKIKELRIISEAVNQAKDFARLYADEKVKNINWLMAGVVIVCLIGFLQLIIDSFHINSVTYREYSDKNQQATSALKINEDLLNQNQKNQQIIISQQKQIIDILGERDDAVKK